MGVIKFKYKDVDGNGNEVGVFSKKGRLEGDQITFDNATMSVEAILRATRRGNRLIIPIYQNDGSVATIVICITSGDIAALMRAINEITSERWAKARQEALAKQGKGGLFRTLSCPYCGSTNDVSGLDDTVQMYCSYCDTICTRREKFPTVPPDERSYRLCDTCGYYSQPKLFTVFYFYFLLVIYGWRYRQSTMCNSCMRGEAWKMFGANLLFILGVIPSIVQLIRAYFGGSVLSASFSGLDAANARAKKGDIAGAMPLYLQILQRLKHSAGVLHNTGLALVKAGQTEKAIAAFQSALKDCSNYTSAYEELCKALQGAGRSEERAALREAWGDPP